PNWFDDIKLFKWDYLETLIINEYDISLVYDYTRIFKRFYEMRNFENEFYNKFYDSNLKNLDHDDALDLIQEDMKINLLNKKNKKKIVNFLKMSEEHYIKYLSYKAEISFLSKIFFYLKVIFCYKDNIDYLLYISHIIKPSANKMSRYINEVLLNKQH